MDHEEPRAARDGSSPEQVTGRPEWAMGLIRSVTTDLPAVRLHNVAHALREHPKMRRGRLCWSDLHAAPWVRGPLPWAPAPGEQGREWDTQDDLQLTAWLERRGIPVGVEMAGKGVQLVALERPWHPIRAWLETLVWDGEPRLTGWLATYLGATASTYTEAVGARWLISAVARAMEPGCKADAVLMLQGPQGCGKSTALATLGGGWYTDDVPDLSGGKDAQLALRGVWLLELSELDALGQAEDKRIKAFFSRSVDRYRPPYGARMIAVPRSCVLAGTTNAQTYLKDETGGRRFWPVSVAHEVPVDLNALRADRMQLWAEAVQAWRDGAAWHLETDELRELAAEEAWARYHEDPWTARVLREAHALVGLPNRPAGVTIDEILTGAEALAIPVGQVRKSDADRVARILVAAGWERTRPRASGTGPRPRRYVPPRGLDREGGA